MLPQNVLTNWLIAVYKFQYNYAQLSHCLNGADGQQQQASPSVMWVGQCPVSQVIELLMTMQIQLKELSLDADQFDPVMSSQDDQKLLRHTLILEQLNQQAQTLLQLAVLKAS